MYRLLSLAFGSVLLMAVIALGFSSQSAPQQAKAPQIATGKSQAGGPGDDLELASDAAGRFHLDAQVNGEDARFLLETGAYMVALTLADAERLGVPVDPDNLQPIAQTASGVGYGAAVKIDRITIAGQEFNDIDAMVIEGLGVNLLGRSLIARLGSLEIHGKRMVIRRI